MSRSAVRINDLTVAFENVKALNEINLMIPKGQVVGLLGPSGAGKTTLIRTIVGLQKITAGDVGVLGHVASSAELRHQIGYMAQDPDIYQDLTVRENILYFAKLVSADPQYIDKLVEDVELSPQLDQLASTLSGGQLVRLSLIIALLGQPELIILDEPTVGLDPVLREKLWKNFHKLADSGSTVIVTSHVMDEARRCDYLVLVRNGQIIAEDTPANLIKKSKAKDMEGAFLKIVGGST